MVWFCEYFVQMTFLVFFTIVENLSSAYGHPNYKTDTKGNCSQSANSPKIKQAYIGWPLSIDCGELPLEVQNQIYPYDTLYNENYSEEQVPIEAECFIWDLKQKILLKNFTYNPFNEAPTFPLHDLQLNDTLKYEVTLSVKQLNICTSTIVNIEPIQLPNLTCKEALQRAQVIDRKIELNHPAAITCEVPSSEEQYLRTNKYTTGVQKWLHNCEELQLNSDVNQRFPNEIRISNISYKHSGTYTCVITYNNQVWYAVHHQLCVEPTADEPSLVCSSPTVSASIGQTAAIECHSHAGSAIRQSTYVSKWEKANKTICKFPGRENNKFKCSYDEYQPPCFTKTPTIIEMRTFESRSNSLRLTIQNVQELDLGEYIVTLRNVLSGRSIKRKVLLKVDRSGALLGSTIAIGVGVATVAMALLVLLLVCACQQTRRNKWKRKDSIEEITTVSETVMGDLERR